MNVKENLQGICSKVLLILTGLLCTFPALLCVFGVGRNGAVTNSEVTFLGTACHNSKIPSLSRNTQECMNLCAILGLYFAYKHHSTFIYIKHCLLMIYYSSICLVRTFCSSLAGPLWFSGASTNFLLCKLQHLPPLLSCLWTHRKEQVPAQMSPHLTDSCSPLSSLPANASTASPVPLRD